MKYPLMCWKSHSPSKWAECERSCINVTVTLHSREKKAFFTAINIYILALSVCCACMLRNSCFTSSFRPKTNCLPSVKFSVFRIFGLYSPVERTMKLRTHIPQYPTLNMRAMKSKRNKSENETVNKIKMVFV